MPMPNRQYSLSSKGYRFSFNGKEDDSEINGQQDYGLRIYNKLLGRFLSVDPLSKKFAYYTPYQFAANTPIGAIDLDGAEAMVVTIRDMVADPALKQVNLQKLTAKAEQANLSVEYRYQDSRGNLTRVECFDSYKQGTVEAQMANQTNSAGVRTEDRLRAGSYNNSNRFVDNSIQDPQSNPSVNNGRMLTANNGFQYDLNIQYKPDGSQLNETDLKAGTLPDVQNQITNAQTTLNNNSIPYVGFNGENKVANMQQYNITVVGQTDGSPSNYVGNTPGNTQPQGNPALAQDRANNVRSSLGTMSGRTLNTSTVNNSGSSNQDNRSTKLLITR
jgi:RHS repeat-associated protein